MPVTVRELAADRGLGIRVLAGQDALDDAVSWVHVSELADPTPFLEGGELLLTTGLGLRADTDVPAFVSRLADSGISGLGFGVGLSHETVPAELVRAARLTGIPLLEVARETPFIAISKAVSAALAADAYAEVTATNAAQQALTRAAIGRAGVAGLVRRLARLLNAWVLVLDNAGQPVHAVPASAIRRLPELSAELARVRATAGPASSAFAHNDVQVVVQALSTRPRTVLVAGRPAPMDRADRYVLNSAAALLTLALARSRALATAQRHLRTGLMRLLLVGEARAVHGPVDDLWEPLPDEPVQLLVVDADPAAREALVDRLDAEPCGFWAELDDRVVVVAAARSDAVDRVSGLLDASTHLGVSAPARYPHLADAHRQAARAAAAAGRGGEPVMHFDELGGKGVLGLVAPDDARAYAESLLAPLLRHDATGRGELLDTLREWLRQHGQWDPASARLGVHRHTVRNRIARAADLLGRDLGSPRDRAELWLALELLDER